MGIVKNRYFDENGFFRKIWNCRLVALWLAKNDNRKPSIIILGLHISDKSQGRHVWFKTTVFLKFLKARNIDKDRQYSSLRQTTIYGLRFFEDFLKNLWIAIDMLHWCSLGDNPVSDVLHAIRYHELPSCLTALVMSTVLFTYGAGVFGGSEHC